MDKLYELQHSGPHDSRVRLHIKKEVDTYRLQHAMDMVVEQLPSMLELGEIPEHIINESYSFPYHVPSIVSLASAVPDEMPEMLGYVLLQECYWLNALLCHIRQSLYELDKHLLGGEHAIPEELLETTKSLQEEFVPISWTHPNCQPSTHTLLTWLNDLNKRYSQLKQWIKEGKVPSQKRTESQGAHGELTSVWLGGLCNPSALVTALRQEMAVLSECLLSEVILECDVSMSMDKNTFEIKHEGGMYLQELYLQGALWDMENKCLAPPEIEMNLMPSVYVRPVLKSSMAESQQSEEGASLYECPVYINKARQVTAFTLHLKCPYPVEQWTLAGTAILLDPGAPEESIKKSKGFTAIKREMAMVEDDVSERVASSLGSKKSGTDNASEQSRASRRSARSLRSHLSDQAHQKASEKAKYDSTWSVRSENLEKERYSYSMFDYRAPTLREKRLEDRQKRRQDMLEHQDDAGEGRQMDDISDRSSLSYNDNNSKMRSKETINEEGDYGTMSESGKEDEHSLHSYRSDKSKGSQKKAEEDSKSLLSARSDRSDYSRTSSGIKVSSHTGRIDYLHTVEYLNEVINLENRSSLIIQIRNL
ncbi:uncharacterized protein LOC100369618 [Saccoglossus kowalevskii]|uniref:Uncharacterized protein LOC100369618 n=1 Tax=Saccoglossus kowalevskii TaxID=10224 RepID=A0ABM0M9T9_SACKO|nr:PREDICTED: uncharacterized protein LOC100369618 [Saccoglossus kowalevskii]